MIRNKNIIEAKDDVYVPAKLNLGKLLVERMETYGEICTINGQTGETITFRQILQQAMNVAISLAHLGVRKGVTVALFSENRIEFIPAAIGIICTGATITTVNTAYTKGELKHVLNIAKPKFMFCSEFAYKNHAQTLKSVGFIEKIILFGNSTPNILSYNSLAFPDGIRKDSGNYISGINESGNGGVVFDKKAEVLRRNVLFQEFRVAEVKGQDDVACILYSSGTTGLPKGVMLTHLNVLTVCVLAEDPGGDYGLSIAPWFHAMGLMGQLGSLAAGRSTIFLPKFEVELYFKIVEKYKIDVITVVPPVLIALCKSPLKYDMSSVKFIFSGAAPLDKDTLLSAKKTFPNAQVLQGYGMTEVTLGAIRDMFYTAHLSKPGGVGLALPGTSVKVADLETGKALGPNQRGEIRLIGPQLMKGYVGRPLSEDLDEDGYFKTGDIGYYDEDHIFYIVDRLKELIKYKGYQVPPAEIEGVLLQHPEVKDAGVVGIPHPSAGEVPLAFVVRQPGSKLSEDEVKAFVAERLSNPKQLRGGVRFVDQIPKNPSGKILRKVLRTMEKKGKSKL